MEKQNRPTRSDSYVRLLGEMDSHFYLTEADVSPGCRFRVIEDYEGQKDNGELTVREGDLVELLSSNGDGWLITDLLLISLFQQVLCAIDRFSFCWLRSFYLFATNNWKHRFLPFILLFCNPIHPL